MHIVITPDEKVVYAPAQYDMKAPAVVEVPGMLRAVVEQWIRGHMPQATRQSYATYQKQWRAFCEWQGYSVDNVREEHVAAFMKYLSCGPKPLARATIGVAVSAVSDLYRFSVMNPTRGPLVAASRKTVARIRPTAVHKIPLYPCYLDMVAEMFLSTNEHNWFKIRDLFICLMLGYFTLRRSELSEMTLSNVKLETVTRDGAPVTVLHVYVPRAKNDQFGDGHDRWVATQGRVWSCPIVWYNTWMAIRGNKGVHLVCKQDGGALW